MKSLHHLLLAFIAVLLLGGCSSQSTFDSPQQAFDALFDATRDRNREALRDIFGPRATDLLSGDAQQDEADFQRFAAALERHAELTPEEDGQIFILVGESLVPFVAPLTRDGDRWRFDTDAAVEEITNRRIGRNELHAIKTGKAYAQAQFEYYVMDPDDDGVRCYAQRIRSTPGKRDGLYWPDEDDNPSALVSPLGPLITEAVAAGDVDLAKTKRQPYEGYYYRILTRQGAAAPGGAKNYIDAQGLMTGGHALIMWPEHYDETGVMTFLVDRDGNTYEKDLGESTTATADRIIEFNPDATWKKTAP